MESIWPDLREIIFYGDITLYQFLGFLTVALALLNIVFYLIAAALMWRTTHQITNSLKHKFVVESFLALTTVLMGFGALVDAPSWFWQLSYVCRVGLLIIAPFVLYRVVVACKAIINAQRE